MAKAYAVGEKYQILGFKGVGFEIIPVTDAERFAEELFHLSRGYDVSLVLVTEALAKESPQVIREFRTRSTAILVIIPTHEGSMHLSINEMRIIVEHSMGIDLLGKSQESEQR